MSGLLIVVLFALAGVSCGALVAAFGLPMAYLILAAFGGGIVLLGAVE